MSVFCLYCDYPCGREVLVSLQNQLDKPASHLNLWFPASLSWCRFNSELVRKALLQLVQTKVLLL